ncbi:Frizzy aggregation protein FrzCD [Enhygromyxa salina]|uniref:Frizzy aggregation protein FrzCD n=1 Tax=Enhygromyxa salina TaxID=215803 RepID=A0A2S9YGS4_9BACT|nr:methyl-accepting chemotaxis protein [Enhygromyxa salina]PRQ04308.1 Frizzy aggregation protein FrzCD [Enhygromyxa salina]
MRDVDVSTRILIRFNLLDLGYLLLLPFAWAHVIAVDWGVALGPAAVVTLLRWISTTALLRWLLRPADLWRAALDRGDDQPLLAASEALERAPRSFTAGCVLSTVSAYVLATAYGWFALPETMPLGSAELVALSLLCMTIACGYLVFCYPVLTLLIENERIAVAEALDARGLAGSRTPSSMAPRLGGLALALTLGPAFWFGAAGWSTNTSRDRERTVDSLTQVSESDAARVAAGLSPKSAKVVRLDVEPGANPSANQVTIDRRKHRVSVAAPIGDGRFALSAASIERTNLSYGLELLVFMAGIAIWAPMCAWFLGRSLMGPLRRLEDATRRLVEVGDVGQIAHVPLIQADEIGTLTRSFNEVVDSLEELVRGAQIVAGGDLSANIEGRGELAEVLHTMVVHLRDMVANLREAVTDLASAASKIQASTREQEQAIHAQLSRMLEVRDSMSSLSASAADITASAGSVLDNAEQSLANTDTMSAKIAELTAHSDRIGTLLEVIREVADRSDLLALNGSLEATRAGEAGRGFALVAAEMRRLAERVMGNVADVRGLVADITASGASTTMATEQSRKLADGTAATARRIATVTERQRAATEQAREVVSETAEFMARAAIAISQTRSAAEELGVRAHELEQRAGAFRLDSEEQ